MAAFRGGAVVRLEQSLSSSDRRRIQETLARVQVSEHARLSLTGLLEEWKGLAESIARGESWSLTSFNRGLKTRDLIEEISEGLSMDGRRIVLEALNRIDQDFIAATYDPLKPGSKSPPETEIGWWEHRIPRVPGMELEFGLPELGMGIEPPFEESGGLA